MKTSSMLLTQLEGSYIMRKPLKDEQLNLMHEAHHVFVPVLVFECYEYQLFFLLEQHTVFEKVLIGHPQVLPVLFLKTKY